MRLRKSHKIQLENPILFLNCLIEGMTKYTNLNPASQEGVVFSYTSTLSVSQLQTSKKNYKNLKRVPRLPNKP
jgi:hypothetical protein